MNTYYLSFLISFLAGISTIIGYLPTYISSKYQNRIIPFSLSFSAGVMLTISFGSLIPEAFRYLHLPFSFPSVIIFLIFMNIGIILSLFIDIKIDQKLENSSLYKLGILSVLAIILHNIPEGITTYLTAYHDLSLGIFLAVAIALHNIPEGIAIAIPIYYATNNRKKAFFYTFISGFSEFFGAILAHVFLKDYINFFLLFSILSITAGIMIYLSLFDLLPNSVKYHHKNTILLGFILGCIMMVGCLLLL